jgi:hypothetical protein
MGYLTNPMYAMMQMDWMNKIQGGSGFFDQNGKFQLPNMGGNIWNNMGWAPSSTTSTTGSSTTAASTGDQDKDKELQAKFTKMTNFMKRLAAYSDLESTDKSKLDVALQHKYSKDDTWEDKVKYLQDALNDIDKAVVKDFVLNGDATLTVNGASNGTKISDALVGCGYEFANKASIARTSITSIEQTISGISDNDTNIELKDEILASLAMKDGRYDILSVISRWRTVYKDDASKVNILKLITKKYNEVKDKSGKDTVKTQAIQPFVDRLIDKAEELKNNKNLDSSTRDKINEEISKLSNEYSKDLSSNIDNIANAFDNLYILLRKASIAIVSNDMSKYYGEIYPSLFNKDLFVDDTENDLKNEGFSSSKIDSATVAIDAKKTAKATSTSSSKKSSSSSNSDDLSSALDSVGSAAFDSLKALAGFPAGVEEAFVQRNVEQGKEPKVYVKVIDDDGKETIYQLENVKLQNGKYVLSSGSSISMKKVSADRIIEEDETNRTKQEEADNIKTKNKELTDKLDEEVKKENLTKSKIDGKDVYLTNDQNKGYRVENGKLYEFDYKNKKIEKEKEVSDISTISDTTLSKEDIHDAWLNGDSIYKNLRGWTINMDNFYNNLVPKVNENNILYVIQGYSNAQSGSWFHDKFFKQMLTEDNCDIGTTARKMLKYVIKYTENNLSSIQDEDDREMAETALNKLKGVTINDDKTVEGDLSIDEIDTQVTNLLRAFKIASKTEEFKS